MHFLSQDKPHGLPFQTSTALNSCWTRKEGQLFFNQTGELVVVTRYIPFHRLPRSLRNDLIKQFPNHTSVETLEVMNDSTVDYYATVIENNKTTIISSKYFGRWQEFRKEEK